MHHEATKALLQSGDVTANWYLSVSDENSKYDHAYHDDESVSNFESKQQAKPKSQQTAQNAKIGGGFENNRCETRNIDQVCRLFQKHFIELSWFQIIYLYMINPLSVCLI